MTSESIQHGKGLEGRNDEPRALDLDAGRRAFIRHLGLGAGTAMVGAAVGLPGMAQAQDGSGSFRGNNGGVTDVDVLNFALNLEYLEAEFYLRAAFGRGLSDGDITGGDSGGRDQFGGVRGGRKVDFATKNVRLYAEEIARDEEAHVRFLRKALGNAAVPRPTIDIDGAFTTLARAAGLVGRDQQFDAYANENNFLLAAYVFEDVGVTAYHGAAPLIQDKNVLLAASGILAVEAYHASNIRTVLIARGLFDPANRISDLRDSLDGPEDLDQGIGNSDQTNVVPADDNGIAFARTPRQVLNVVYGQQGAGSGLFFPDSVNGNIRGQS